MDYFLNYLLVFGIYCLYIALLTGLAILFNKLFKIKNYIYRKILHIIATFSIIPILWLSKTYWIALLVVLTIAIGVLVGLLFFERFKFYQGFFVEKRKHEVVLSFMVFYSVLALLIFLFWGVRGEEFKYIIYTSFIAWGIGDASACVFGKTFGKPLFKNNHIFGDKSLIGSIAMLVASTAASIVIMLIFHAYPWYFCLIYGFVVGIVASLVELYTPLGLDNLTIPLMISLTLFLISLI